MNEIDFKKRALEMANETGEEVVLKICPTTSKEIYFSAKDRLFIFDSFGTCTKCGGDFHVSIMQMADDARESAWPVHYVGAFCKTCFYSSDVESGTLEEIKLRDLSDDDQDEE